MPARVVLQDFTGVPCVVDLAAMRDAMARMKGDPDRINPVVPCDLVIDHSVQVDYLRLGAGASSSTSSSSSSGTSSATSCSSSPSGPSATSAWCRPGTGIVHQVNLEYLAPVVQLREQFGELTAYPDTLVGTDSHTTMINGLGVVGWGVGGIEAEAVMLGQPYFMLIPEVVGMKLIGALPARHHRHRPGAHRHPDAPEEGRGGQVRRVLRARALRASAWPTAPPSPTWRPEYGATMGFFPVDAETLRYLERTGRGARSWSSGSSATARSRGSSAPTRRPDPEFTATLELDLSSIVTRASPAPSGRRTWCRSPQLKRNFIVNLPRPDERRRCRPRGKELAQSAYSRWVGEGGANVTIGEHGARGARRVAAATPTRRRS